MIGAVATVLNTDFLVPSILVCKCVHNIWDQIQSINVICIFTNISAIDALINFCPKLTYFEDINPYYCKQFWWLTTLPKVLPEYFNNQPTVIVN